MPNVGWKYRLALALLISISCHAIAQRLAGRQKTPREVSAHVSLQEPLIGETEDLPDTLTGFPDPFPFRRGGDYYLCHSVIDLDNARMYRTKTFARDDLRRYPLSFDFGNVRHVRQI